MSWSNKAITNHNLSTTTPMRFFPWNTVFSLQKYPRCAIVFWLQGSPCIRIHWTLLQSLAEHAYQMLVFQQDHPTSFCWTVKNTHVLKFRWFLLNWQISTHVYPALDSFIVFFMILHVNRKKSWCQSVCMIRKVLHQLILHVECVKKKPYLSIKPITARQCLSFNIWAKTRSSGTMFCGLKNQIYLAREPGGMFVQTKHTNKKHHTNCEAWW